MAIAFLWNLLFTIRLQSKESVPGVPAALIYQGRTPGNLHFAVVNNELSFDSKILLVGDARAFYFQRPIDYCVAFNRNPFFEVIRTARDDQATIGWLKERGYTHILVNWSEVRRLGNTYGFAPPLQLRELAELFDSLGDTGLRTVRQFANPQGGRYVDLYEVP